MSWRSVSWPRIVKHTVLGAIALWLVLLALLSTTVTVRLAASLASYWLPALYIEQIDGDLIHGVTVKRLTWRTAELTVDVVDGQVVLSPSCLPKLCLDNVEATSIQVTLGKAQQDSAPTPSATSESTSGAVTSQPSSSTTSSSALFPSGFELNLQQLRVTEFTFESDSGTLHLNQLASALQLRATEHMPLTLQLATTSMAELSWQAKPNTTQPTALDIGELIEQQLKQWPTWQVEVPSISIAKLKLAQQLVQEVRVSALLTPEAFTIKQLAATYHAIDMTLQTQLQKNGVLQGSFSAKQTPVPKAPKAADLASLRWQGPLQALDVSGEFKFERLPLPDDVLLTQQSQLNATLNLLAKAPEFSLHWQSPMVVIEQTSATVTHSALPDDLRLQASARKGQFNQLDATIKGTIADGELALTAQSQWPGLPNTALALQGQWQDAKLRVQQLLLSTLNGSIELKGDVSSSTFVGSVAVDKLQPGLYWTDFPGEFSGKSNLNIQTGQQLTIALSQQAWQGSLRGLPLSLTGDAKLWFNQHWRLHTEGLALSHGDNQLRIVGQLDDRWQLAFNAEIVDFNRSLPMAEGRLLADIHVAGPYQTPNVQLDINANDLVWGDDFALTSFSFQGLIRQFGDLSSQLTLSLKGLTSPSLQIRSVDWQTQGTLAAHQSHLVINSPQLKADTRFSAGLKQQRWSGQFSDMQLSSDLGQWTLATALQLDIDLDKQRIKLSDSCFNEQLSQVCIQSKDWLSSGDGQLTLLGKDIALQNFDWVLPNQMAITGQATGQATVSWLKGKLAQASWDITAHHGSMRFQGYSPVELPWQQLLWSGQLQKNQLNNELQLTIHDQQQLKATARIDQLTSVKPTLNASLQLQQIQLNFLQPLFNEFSKFTGSLDGQLQFSGPLEQPEVRGSLLMAQLTMTGSAAPLELHPSSISVQFLGRQANLLANLQTAEGPIQFQGSANWMIPDAWYAQSTLAAEQLKLQTSFGDLTLSPNLQLLANPKGGSVTGSVIVPQGNLAFNDLPEDAVRVSADEIMLETKAAAPRSAWQLNTDVRLVLGDQVKFAAFGLKTRLQGELRVRQQNNQPTIHGQVNLHDGVFRAYGQDLQLTKGRLTFNGLPQQPLLSIEAIRNKEKTEDNVVAGIRVNGTADDPSVEVFSKPSKPQANALAYLLLGRDIGTSQGDGAMTTGLIGLGIASSGKLVGKLGEAFGVSDLMLDTAGSGDSSKVTVSGYLSPKLQVKYGVGIFNQLGEFTVRYRIVKQLYLEAVRGLDNSIDVLYKVEFN